MGEHFSIKGDQGLYLLLFLVNHAPLQSVNPSLVNMWSSSEHLCTAKSLYASVVETSSSA